MANANHNDSSSIKTIQELLPLIDYKDAEILNWKKITLWRYFLIDGLMIDNFFCDEILFKEDNNGNIDSICKLLNAKHGLGHSFLGVYDRTPFFVRKLE